MPQAYALTGIELIAHKMSYLKLCPMHILWSYKHWTESKKCNMHFSVVIWNLSSPSIFSYKHWTDCKKTKNKKTSKFVWFPRIRWRHEQNWRIHSISRYNIIHLKISQQKWTTD